MYNSPNAVLKGIRTEFAKRLSENSTKLFSPMAFETTSSGDYEDYLFFDKIPYPKEWKDKISNAIIDDYKLTIRNKAWAMGIDVDRFTLDDSKKELGGSIDMQINSLVQNFKDFSDNLINQLLVANGTAFDGSAFFANSHNIAATVDNLYPGTGVTLAQITADLAGARNDMYGFKDTDGVPFNRGAQFAVVIPTQLHDTFLTLKNSQQVYDGAGNKTNIYQNTFEIVLNHWQAQTNNDWYLVNTNAVVPAFVVQTRENPEWVYNDNPLERYIQYGSYMRMNVGYGNFTSIIKIDN
jgi:phage major head subunit gpT-like protein